MQVSIGSIFYLASFGPEQDSEGEVGHCLSLQLEEGLGCVGVPVCYDPGGSCDSVFRAGRLVSLVWVCGCVALE